MPTLKPNTIIPSDVEDKIITRQALEDGTLLTDEMLENMRPAKELLPKFVADFTKAQKDGTLTVNGRPPLDNPKQQVTVRLDAEIIEYFKQDGKGWQTRLNAALSEYVASH